MIEDLVFFIGLAIIGIGLYVIMTRKKKDTLNSFVETDSVSCYMNNSHMLCTGKVDPDVNLTDAQCKVCTDQSPTPCTLQDFGYSSTDGVNYFGANNYYCGSADYM